MNIQRLKEEVTKVSDPRRAYGNLRHKLEDIIITEEEKMLALVTDAAFRDALIILIDTGIRCGELSRLRIEDYYPSGGLTGAITLWETKGNKARTVPTTRRVKEILDRRALLCSDKRELFFPFSKRWMHTRWNTLREDMGLTSDILFVPHILRHTCASRLMQAGIPVPEVQKWLGHSNIRATMRYAHLAPNSIFGAVSALEG
jgi:integrase